VVPHHTHTTRNPDMTHPNYLGWQVDWPLFVKVPFDSNGRTLKQGEHFNWLNPSRHIDETTVAMLYATGKVHHNKDLEKQSKVGDRLEEFNSEGLMSLVKLLNSKVKERTNSTTEFTSKKCKQSTLDHKQRGQIRSFLRNNRWIEEDFYKIRENLLDNSSNDE